MQIDNARKTLLYLTHEDNYFLSHRLIVAQGAKNAGFRVVVAANPGQAVEKIKEKGFEFYPITFNRGSINPFKEWQTLLQTYRLYRKVKPDIVHHIAIQPVVYGSIAARTARVPKVINAIAGLGYAFTSKSLRARLVKTVLRGLFQFTLGHKNSKVIVQNPNDGEVLKKLGVVKPENIALIYGSGVDLNDYPALADPEGNVIKVGLPSRMIWPKGIAEFVAAAKKLKTSNIQLILAGYPDAKNATSVPEEQLKQWHAEGIIEWRGHVDNMVDFWREVHIACLPSFYGEGVPKALIEAAACTRPIITTNTPGCRDIGQNNVNAVTIPPQNADALAAAITQLAEDENLRKKFGQAGRQLVQQQFSATMVQSQTLALYLEN